MSLLLDFGNSRCKFQIVGQKDIEEHGVWFYPETNKPAVIKSLLHDHRIKNKVIVCSVRRYSLLALTVTLVIVGGVGGTERVTESLVP